jgi:endonuclease/exonuclease/phosphatase family metal-dependent hydrolase
MLQIDRLLKHTTTNMNYVFLCGDFNYADDSNEINHIKNHYYSVSDLANLNSIDNPTFHFSLDNTTQKYNQMIDFIFTNEKININEFKIVFSDEVNYVSDHSGLYLDFNEKASKI